MPLYYENLNAQLNRYLNEKYPEVSLHTDIFEHAFLRFLGYQFVPEKCQFEDSQSSNSLSIFLRTPYEVGISSFLSDLQICATGEFSAISVEEIDPNLNQGRFCVRLSVPYSLIETYISVIFQSINITLEDPNKINFYRYWDIHARKYNAGLTIIRMENLVNQKLLSYPHLNSNDVWGAIIKKNSEKDTEIKFLKKQVLADIINYPKITLVYEEDGNTNKINLTRDQIVATLENSNFDKLLISNITRQEFVPPIGINEFIKEKYHRTFTVNNEGYYEIDLGYHGRERNILEKYGIKELSSYRPDVAGEQTRYYVYDKKTYLQLLIALKEIKGETCCEERLNQLIYYIDNQMWEELNKQLKFLLNLKSETGIQIDYSDLLISFYHQAKEKLPENTFELIEKICKYLVNDIYLPSEKQKEIYNILFELSLMRLNQLENTDGVESICLKKDLFIFSQKAGLEESNHYLAELAGLEFGSTFSENVNKNPLEVLVELAKKNKHTNEENVRLRAEIAKLRATNSLPESIDSLNINSSSYFSLRK